MANMQQVFRDGNGCQFESTVGQLYYDYPNQQMRVDESSTVYDFSFTETVWFDYDNGMGYYYDRDDDTCTEGSISGGLQAPEIPADSIYGGGLLIGGQAIDQWLVSYDEYDMLEILTVTRDTCFVVTDIIYNTTTNQTPVNEIFSNFLPSLPPFYFDIPNICTSGNNKRDNELLQKKARQYSRSFLGRFV